MLKAIGIGVGGLLLIGLALLYAAGQGAFGAHEAPGEVAPQARSEGRVTTGEAAVANAASEIGVSRAKQILFGDLHVHTTFSFDAFLLSLPMVGAEGAHPPADACDFARYCSAMDFWSINDHAFGITPEHWAETVDSIRQCNAVAGDPGNPDMVSYLGWEWTQVGITPESHYGHKNVVLAHTEDERIPARPIASQRIGQQQSVLGRGFLALLAGGRVHDLARYFAEREATDLCPSDVPVRDLPTDCIESAATPAVLYDKLDDWGHEAIVIPHGTTWGFYSPPGASWDKQLVGDMHDEDRQTLIEVYSGHGDSELYRDWRAVDLGPDGATCPEPRDDYLPSCWRAGEIIRARCAAAGESTEECERRAVEARANAAAAGVAGHRTVPGATAGEWVDAGQCQDCREPSFNYRPASSAQYILALGNFDEDPEDPRRFRMGFMASSDNHFARPGTGYKERFRRGMTESLAVGDDAQQAGAAAALLAPEDEEPEASSRPFDYSAPGFGVFEMERQGSFFLTGGLIAAHSEGRDRESIWAAMQRREVYGTSGPRMLLWFDLLNPPGSRGQSLPMGGEATLDDDPIFQVRAVGSFEQLPGCPDDSLQALSPERLEHLCKGECYHPSDQRREITRIEIVRIQPQNEPGEDVAQLIEDPWRSFECDPDPTGCAVTFSDPDFMGDARDTVYYARAFEAEKPGINAGNLRCDYDADGNCVETHPCPGEAGREDDCLAPHEPRAWSSPIFADFGGEQRVAKAP